MNFALFADSGSKMNFRQLYRSGALFILPWFIEQGPFPAVKNRPAHDLVSTGDEDRYLDRWDVRDCGLLHIAHVLFCFWFWKITLGVGEFICQKGIMLKSRSTFLSLLSYVTGSQVIQLFKFLRSSCQWCSRTGGYSLFIECSHGVCMTSRAS